MEKYLELMEIRALTKDEFKELLISEGFKASPVKNDYILSVSEISTDTFQYVCSFYGASGMYFPYTMSGQIGNWGCCQSMFEYLYPEPKDIKGIFHRIEKDYPAEFLDGIFEVIRIRRIPEKEFRKLMVIYNCRYGYYSDNKNEGVLIYNVW